MQLLCVKKEKNVGEGIPPPPQKKIRSPDRVVGSDAHLGDVLRAFDAERLVDLELDRKSVRVPAEPPLHVKSVLVHPPGADFTKPVRSKFTDKNKTIQYKFINIRLGSGLAVVWCGSVHLRCHIKFQLELQVPSGTPYYWHSLIIVGYVGSFN
jgi:hypothetical protein